MSEHHHHEHHFMLSLPHHSRPNSAKGPLVHVRGTIAAVLHEDDDVDGGTHQHLQLLVKDTISIKGGNGTINGQTLFVAIRFGDAQGLPSPIPDLQAGSPIEAQGEYIDAMRARPGTDNQNPVLPVLHFTHHPVGFVVYENHQFA
jgi:hypothetical protein